MNRTLELLENLRRAANELSEEFLDTELNNLKSNAIYPFHESFDVVADKINRWVNAATSELEGKRLYKVIYKDGDVEIISADELGETNKFNTVFNEAVKAIEVVEKEGIVVEFKQSHHIPEFDDKEFENAMGSAIEILIESQDDSPENPDNE